MQSQWLSKSKLSGFSILRRHRNQWLIPKKRTGQTSTNSGWYSGWWFQPLWKIGKSVGMILPNIWKKKCSKPPTRTELRAEATDQQNPWQQNVGAELLKLLSDVEAIDQIIQDLEATIGWPNHSPKISQNGFVWKCWVYSQWNSHLKTG